MIIIFKILITYFYNFKYIPLFKTLNIASNTTVIVYVSSPSKSDLNTSNKPFETNNYISGLLPCFVEFDIAHVASLTISS
jgi:hypothetical protein